MVRSGWSLEARVTSPARDTLTVSGSLVRYWLAIRPQVAPLLRQFERWASEIPNPVLRERAQSTLVGETLNPEGTAVFATLVPNRHLTATTRLMVALEVLYDYLDTIGEDPSDDPLRNGLQHHEALMAALQPDAPTVDYYEHHPHGDDGGYLQRLVDTCRGYMEGFPSLPAVLPTALHAARRCSEAQAHTHAAIYQGTDELEAWSLRQERANGYRWWELAAGGISSLSLFAVLAAATDASTTASDAERIDAAYFPSVCAFSALLDSLSDYDRDAGVASSVGHYPSNEEAASRISSIAVEADRATRRLPQGRRHAAILAGLAGFFLSSPTTDTPFARPIKTQVSRGLRPMLPPIMATMRARRRIRPSSSA
jgi:tetraprenyl-beta-curcumene synthase